VWKLVSLINMAMHLIEQDINAYFVVFTLALSSMIEFLPPAIAGIVLVQRNPAGRIFALVVCSIALAFQLLGFAYTLGQSSTLSPGMVFWTIHITSIVLYLAGIIVIARWHPPRLAGY
jgi:hypothetical protein